MKSNSASVLGLMLLACWLAAAPACAEDAARNCDVPAYLLATESPLPKVTEAIMSGRQREGLEVAELLKPFPIEWDQQEALFLK